MIPAPLLNRHTAVAVVVVTLLVAGFALLRTLVSLPAPVFVAGSLLLVAQAVVLALGIFLVWRTLAPHSRAAAGAGLAAIAGFLLYALVQLVAILDIVGDLPDAVILVLQGALVAAAVLVALGLSGLGVVVLRHRAWRGPTSATLLVAGALLVPLAIAWVVLTDSSLLYALWSLLFLGLAVGLRTRREVPDAGWPDTQLGAAKV